MLPYLLAYLALFLIVAAVGSALLLKRRGAKEHLDLPTHRSTALPWICIALSLVCVLIGRQFTQSVMKVQVTVRGDTYRVVLDNKEHAYHRDSALASGGIGLYLDATEGPTQVWRNIRVLSIDGKRELFKATGNLEQDGFTRSREGWIASGKGEYRLKSGTGFLTKPSKEWRDYILEAELVNPTDAGVLVRFTDHGNRVRFWMRPQRHHDSGIEVFAQGRKVSQGQGNEAVGEDFTLLATQTLHQLLRSLSLALLLVFTGSLISGLLLVVIRKTEHWEWKGNVLGAIIIMALVYQIREFIPRQIAISTYLCIGLLVAVSLLLPLLLWRSRVFLHKIGDLPAALLIAIGFVIAASLICIRILEAMPHVQDSCILYFQAKIFAMGRLWLDSHPLYRFFDHEFVINEGGKWYGKYPPGASFVLMLGILAGHPWIVNPLMGGIGLFLIFLCARELFGRTVALIALSLGAVSSFALIQSASFMSHAIAMAFLAAFTYGFIMAWQYKKRWYAVLSGIGLGAGFLCRPQTSAMYSLPFVILVMVGLFGVYRKWRSGADPGGRTMKKTLFRHCLIAIFAISGILMHMGYNWKVTGNPLRMPFRVYSQWDKLGFGQVGPEWPVNHTPAKGMGNTLFNLAELQARLYGWESELPEFIGVSLIGLSIAFMFIPFVTGMATKWDIVFASSFVFLVVMFFFYWANGVCYGPRYWFECMPVFLILTARGIAVTFTFLPDIITRGQRIRPDHGLPVLLSLLLTAALLHLSVQFDRREMPTYREYNVMGRNGLDFIEQKGIHNALVFVRSHEIWQQYGQFFWSMPLDLHSADIIYARDQGLHNVAIRGKDPIPNTKLMEMFPGRKYYYYDGGSLKEIPGPGQNSE